MPKVTFGKLEIVPLTDAWESEPQDFTPWLAKNLDLLGDALQIDLAHVQTEASVGKFRLDILARDGSGEYVAIENQLYQTDHGHLGQLLTYAAGHNVRTLIWIASNFRDEHKDALTWISHWTQEDIAVYGVEVRVLRIGKSDYVPEFIPVVYPDDSRPNMQMVPDSSNLKEFYQKIVDRLRKVDGFADALDPKAGFLQKVLLSKKSPLTYNMDAANNPRVIITMDDKTLKNRVFNILRRNTGEMRKIEKELGIAEDEQTKIVWGNIGGQQNIRVRIDKADNNLTPEVADWMYCYLIKFKKVFDDRIADIVNNPPAAEPDDQP